MLTEEFKVPLLIQSVQFDIHDGICQLVRNGKYNETALIRIPPLGAVILSWFDGRHLMSEIISSVAFLFNITYEESETYVFRTVNIFNGLIEEANGRVRKLPSASFIINNVNSYTEKDIIEQRRDYPRDIYYSATDACNFFCRYCYRDSRSLLAPESYVPYSRWEILLKEAHDNGCQFLNIAGGDPMLRTDIDMLVKIASENKIRTKISTKEMLSDEKILKLKSAGLSILQVSLDSTDPQICASLTGVKNSYYKAIHTIERAKQMGMYVLVSATITRFNINNIGSLVEYLDGKDVDAINLGVYVPSCGRNVDEFVPSSEQMKELGETVFQLNKKGLGINIVYNYTPFGQTSTNLQQICVERAFCRACRDVITIRHDGEVRFCDALLNYDGISMGNVQNQTIKEIWNSSQMLKWITPDRRAFHDSPCGTCRLFEKCFGKRCYKRSIMMAGTPLTYDPLCPKGELNPHFLWKAVGEG